jgi:hypothetical protein
MRSEPKAYSAVRAIRPDLGLIQEDRQVLLVSARHDVLRRKLEERRVSVAVASEVMTATQHMVAGAFDVIALDPGIPGAISSLKTLKLSAHSEASPALRRVRLQQPYLPVFVLPLKDDVEYAVIVRAPVLAYLEDERRIPLVKLRRSRHLMLRS